MTAPNDDFVSALDIEQLDTGLFRGHLLPNRAGVAFGGHVASQALLAAIRSTGPEYAVHSMHSYFLLAGDPRQPVHYEVETIRDGRSFETRRVAAKQAGRAIYYQTSSFQKHEEGFEHQEAMPTVAAPERGVDIGAFLLEDLARIAGEEAAAPWRALEARGVAAEDGSSVAIWYRVAGAMPEDPALHAAAFTFASDISILFSSLVPHGVRFDQSMPEALSSIMTASLDHTVWFHRPFRVDDWWLYVQRSPSASGGRALSFGSTFSADGRLVATVAQEGLIRPLRK